MRQLLWIDEDQEFREMAGNYLRGWDFTVRFLSAPPAVYSDLLNGQALIWDFTFSRPQDQAMLASLRAHAQGGGYPVLLLYSRPMTLDERLFLNEHRFSYTQKWISLWAILQKIQELID